MTDLAAPSRAANHKKLPIQAKPEAVRSLKQDGLLSLDSPTPSRREAVVAALPWLNDASPYERLIAGFAARHASDTCRNIMAGRCDLSKADM